MSERTPAGSDNERSDLERQERDDFRTYVRGAGFALLTTLVPFALVHWSALPRLPLLALIGVFALAQLLVHFRFFLHIDLKRRREDLWLLLFTALLLAIMVAGTIWIMASLAARMSMPTA